MHTRSFLPLAVTAGVVVLGTLAAGCETSSRRRTGPLSRLPVVEKLASGPARSASISTAGPAALVGNDAISLDDLRPALVEAAGAEVLEDAVLDIALRRECERSGIVVTPQDTTAEQVRLLRSLERSANLSDADAAEMLADMQRRRGLGPVRFAGLLKRNAMLRALVRADPALASATRPSSDDLRTAYQLKHGPKVVARLILVSSLRDADRAIERLRTESLDAVAASMSNDPSRARGGLLDPISPADPALPEAIRRAVQTLQPGQTSEALGVVVGEVPGYAIIRIEQSIPGNADAPAFDSMANQLGDEIRLVRERAAMERKAREILAQAGVSVTDPELGRAWDDRKAR